MRVSRYENIYNKERFFSQGRLDVKMIDGVEYVQVYREGTTRAVLVRKDFLKKLVEVK